MGRTIPKKVPQWMTILRNLTARNDSIDLATPSAQHADDATSWRVRIFKLDEENRPKRILVDQPYSINNPISARPGMRFLGLLVDNNLRYGFDTKILERATVQLNSSINIPAVWLSWPTKVAIVQRRNYFRVSTISIDLPNMTLAEVVDLESCKKAEEQVLLRHSGALTGETIHPETHEPCNAFISNISGGGIGAAVEYEHASKLLKDKLYWVTFSLPDCPFPLQAVAKCVHLVEQKDHPAKIGLKFVFDHNPAYRNFFTDHVCEFTAWQQRVLLQRRRGA